MNLFRQNIRFLLITVIAATGVLPTKSQNVREILEAVSNNPEIIRMKTENEATLLQQKAENVLSGPEVEFEHLWGRSGRKWGLSVMQNFDWPGRYKARKAVAEQNRLTLQYSVETLELELRTEAARVLTSLYYNQKRIEAIDRLIAGLQRQSEALDSALNHGVVTILDAKKTNIQLTSFQIERDKLVGLRSGLVGQLEQLIGSTIAETSDDWSMLPCDMNLRDLDYYLAQVPKDPSVLMANSMESSALLAMKEVSMSNMPGFGIGYKHDYEEATHFNGFGISINLPTWNISARRNAARSAVNTSLGNRNVKIQLLETRIRSEYNTALQLKQSLVRLNKNGMDGTYLSLLTQAVQGGEMTVFDYLREVEYYRSVELEMIDLEEQYAQTVTSLNRYHL